jgi:hypothetical protein
LLGLICAWHDQQVSVSNSKIGTRLPLSRFTT